MTHRDFYACIRDHFQNSNDPDERQLAATAIEYMTRLDETNAAKRAKQQAKAAAKQAERAPIRDALMSALGTEPLTATALISAAGLENEVEPTAIPALLKPLIEAGLITKTEVKVKGKGAHRAYAKA